MSNPLIQYEGDSSDMTQVSQQTNPNVPVERVSEYYTIQNNLPETWPQEIAKVSEDISGSKNEECSERVKGQYTEKQEEMRSEVIVDKEQNSRLVTRKTQGSLKEWDSTRQFQGN